MECLVRRLILFFGIFSTALPLFALDVTINYGKELTEHFSVFNISHTEPLECKEHIDTQDVVTHIVCSIERTPVASFSPTETLFFRFWSRVVDNSFYLYIEPKHKIKLYATPSDLKNGALITKEQPRFSKSWQIIGYKNILPFVHEEDIEKRRKGINFPIKIIKNKELYFEALDINRGPLYYDDSEDFDTYSQIKVYMANQNYIEAVKLIDEMLNNYPNSIFAKDLLLFRLRALEHFDSSENSDMIVDMGTKWIKKYPTDSNVPEVLYYLGNAYADMRIPAEAKYYFERTISEYPTSRYNPLSKMALAKNFNTGPDFNVAVKLFAAAYQEAKDVNSASDIAIEWATFHIKNHNKDDATKLLDTMIKANPKYFGTYPIKNYEFLNFLADNELYSLAARFGEQMYNNLMTEDISKEQLLNRVSLWYEAANDIDNAHRINKIFMQDFENRPFTEEIKDRDDKLLFALAQSEDNEEKLKKYDYILEHYKDTEEAAKALELKAEVLFNMKRYDDLLALKDIIKSQHLIADTYAILLKEAIDKDDCKLASNYYLIAPNSKLDEAQKMPFFDCLYSLSLNKEAATIAQDMAQNATSITTKLEWLYREANNFAKLGDSKSTAKAARDALALAKSLKSAKHYDVGFLLFNALQSLNNKAEALEAYSFLKANKPDDDRMLGVNLVLLKDAEAQKDELGIDLYAKDILRLQELSKNTLDSPYVDFALAQSYIRTQRTQDVIKVLDNLLKKDINDDNKQKALYLKGSVMKTAGLNAEPIFKECSLIEYNGAWKSLCNQALDILQGG